MIALWILINFFSVADSPEVVRLGEMAYNTEADCADAGIGARDYTVDLYPAVTVRYRCVQIIIEGNSQ